MPKISPAWTLDDTSRNDLPNGSSLVTDNCVTYRVAHVIS